LDCVIETQSHGLDNRSAEQTSDSARTKHSPITPLTNRFLVNRSTFTVWMLARMATLPIWLLSHAISQPKAFRGKTVAGDPRGGRVVGIQDDRYPTCFWIFDVCKTADEAFRLAERLDKEAAKLEAANDLRRA
jgi:hypothetical protein